jgi:hypothetical protein
MTDSGMRRLPGMARHTTTMSVSLAQLSVCTVEGEVRPRVDAEGFDVALDVMAWCGSGLGLAGRERLGPLRGSSWAPVSMGSARS